VLPCLGVPLIVGDAVFAGAPAGGGDGGAIGPNGGGGATWEGGTGVVGDVGLDVGPGRLTFTHCRTRT
jgi:hypothetical protein